MVEIFHYPIYLGQVGADPTVSEDLGRSMAALLEAVFERASAVPPSEPRLRVNARWSFPDFKYEDNGPVLGNGYVVQEEERDWHEEADRILSDIRGREVYQTCLKEVETHKTGSIVPDAFLDSRIRGFASEFLAHPSGGQATIAEMAASMRSDLLGLPVPIEASVRLLGILIPGAELKIRHRDTTFNLRQTKHSDVELPYGYLGGPSILDAPDAVLEIRMSGKPFLEIQEQENRAVTMLRLFANAPVQVLSTVHSADYGRRLGGIVWPGRSHGTWRKSKLDPLNQDALQRFWDGIYGRLPPTFYRFGEPSLDPVSVAHDRFKDAHANGDVFERCIMNAVMGLEALFFKPTGEQAELTYRLSMRVARFLSCIGYDAVKTREIVEFAYSVRSGYVHGGRASAGDKRRIQRQYTDLANFQSALLDLLKVSIVAGLVRQSDKEEFIDLIDDSMVDARKLSDLQDAMVQVRSTLSVRP